ncbi:MAG TPA: hypothetical protein VGE26_12140 [Sphingobacteriaceae bacterium]
MKRILLIALLSYGAAYYYLDKQYWEKANPDNFVKSEADARNILHAQALQTEGSEGMDEELKKAYSQQSSDASDISFLAE